jgi:hypothetical protein
MSTPSDRIRAAARQIGIGPDDPMGPLFDAVADLPEDCSRRFDALFERLGSAIASAERLASGAVSRVAVANLPQAIDRAIVARASLWSAGLIFGAFVLGGAAGLAEGAFLWHEPGGVTCEVQKGGLLCYSWRIPPTK